jgi:hypothetical protein
LIPGRPASFKPPENQGEFGDGEAGERSRSLDFRTRQRIETSRKCESGELNNFAFSARRGFTRLVNGSTMVFQARANNTEGIGRGGSIGFTILCVQ